MQSTWHSLDAPTLGSSLEQQCSASSNATKSLSGRPGNGEQKPPLNEKLEPNLLSSDRRVGVHNIARVYECQGLDGKQYPLSLVSHSTICTPPVTAMFCPHPRDNETKSISLLYLLRKRSRAFIGTRRRMEVTRTASSPTTGPQSRLNQFTYRHISKW